MGKQPGGRRAHSVLARTERACERETVANDDRGRIEIHIRELNQLFHSLDPAPFYDRDLDAAAEKFIVENARQVSRDAQLSLVVYLDEGEIGEAGRVVADAVRVHFARRAREVTGDLRELFRRGRISLTIGLPFLAASILGGEMVAEYMEFKQLAEVLKQSFLVGGWVAMWRPMEIFLYDWWPIRNQRRLFQRLAGVDVRVTRARAA